MLFFSPLAKFINKKIKNKNKFVVGKNVLPKQNDVAEANS